MLFDFEGNEVCYIMKLVYERTAFLAKQPQSRERDEEMLVLWSFSEKMLPVIQMGKAQAHMLERAILN